MTSKRRIVLAAAGSVLVLIVAALVIATALSGREDEAPEPEATASPVETSHEDPALEIAAPANPEAEPEREPEPDALELLLPLVRLRDRSPLARRKKIEEIIEAAGDRAPEVLLTAWCEGVDRYTSAKKLREMRGPEARRAQRRLLVAAASRVRPDTETAQRMAQALLEADERTGLHATLYYLENIYWGPALEEAFEDVSGGEVDLVPPPESRRGGYARGDRGERWTDLGCLASLEAAEKWWAARREEMLAPIARDIERLRADAAREDEHDPWPRRAAVTGLYVLGAETSEEWLLALLRDRDGFVQSFAAKALLRRGLFRFVDEAADTVRRSPDRDARVHAATMLHAALKHTGSKNPLSDARLPDARAALIAALDDPDPMVARAAALTLLPGKVPYSPGSSRGFRFKLLGTRPWAIEGVRRLLDDIESGGVGALEAFAREGNEWHLDGLVARRRALRREADSSCARAALAKAGRTMLDLKEADVEERCAFLRRALASPLRDLFLLSGPDIRRESTMDTLLVGGKDFASKWLLFKREDLPALMRKLETPGVNISTAIGAAIGRLAGEDESKRLRRALDRYLFHPHRAAAAGLALAMTEDTDAVPQLRAVLRDGDFEFRARNDRTVAYVGLALAGLGDWERLPEIRTPIEKVTTERMERRARQAQRRAEAKQEAESGRSRPPRGTISVGTRFPPGWQPDPWRPPTISLPELSPAMTPEEARAALEDWWADRRAYRLRAGWSEF